MNHIRMVRLAKIVEIKGEAGGGEKREKKQLFLNSTRFSLSCSFVATRACLSKQLFFQIHF